ncbi:unnamed protein product [Candidula unifasciata]|uniref:Uncharacterized protein n=1 Tax=Candidula unifasciata TaxID=100452 RepID=A0A8S3ZF93_9EUPU|nr:unnamed protein product [Candidula unifasciata]
MFFIFFLTVARENTQGNFPLQNCEETTIEVLSLLDDSVDISWEEQHDLVLSFCSESPFCYGATVVDQLSAHTETSSFSDWIYQNGFRDYPPYMGGYVKHLELTRNVSIVLELKIGYVERLFEEISAQITDEAVRVGIIYLDGTTFTYEELKNVSSSLKQRKATDLKILVVVVGYKLEKEIVLLFDTIVLPDKELKKFGQYLLMAMCSWCSSGWFSLQHTTSLDMLSCYTIYHTPELHTWSSESKWCSTSFNSYLATIETVEEMLFLRKQAYEVFEEFKVSDLSFHIGLRRDVDSYEKRFQWETTSGRYRPLLFNHWLPGKPSRRFVSNDCGVWRFTNIWTDNKDSPNVVTNITKVASNEGWTDVYCQKEILSLAICEVTLPRRFNDSIQDQNEDGILKLQNGRTVSYLTKFVSVSANVANPTFFQFLKDNKQDFPIFDCGEDVGDGRYISYSLVCDFVDHCRNKRDELSCVNPRELNLENEVFCTSGQRLHSSKYICDNVKDCRDGSDEDDCMADNCKSVPCHDGSCLPLQWIDDGHIDCFIYENSNTDCFLSEENSHANVDFDLHDNTSCALVCNRDNCIDESMLNDGVEHCTGSEGPLDETIGALEPARTCRNAFGHFIWAPKCHYIKYRYGGIIGCRDMSHLRDCENFLCGHGFMKCYDSYCIPHHYLRDGKADCPTGEDEQLFYIGPRTGKYFACWDSNIFLHPVLVCNGRTDCPLGDDELDCHELCPGGFRCVAGTVMPSGYNSTVFSKPAVSDLDRRTRYLDLSGVEMEADFLSTFLVNDIPFNLKVLIMSKCSINSLYIPNPVEDGKKPPPLTIQKLDISYNIFEIFSEPDYNYYYKHIHYLNLSHNHELRLLTNLRFNLLEILDLSYTSILSLNDSVFASLPRLMHLNLSHTLISDFSGLYFNSKRTLQTLDLRGIPAEDIHDYSFHGLAISHTLYTDHFEICCPNIQSLIIASHACKASADAGAISSCFNLLGISVQRYLLWIVASLAVLGNVTVIVYRVIWDRSVLKSGFGLFVTNLGISDFIMGVYLFIIAGADYFFRDNYVLHDKSWRTSVVCKIAGFMACLSCEASTFFVFLITLDRFLVMKFPFGQKKCSKLIKISAVVLSWVASFLLALVPIVFGFDIYSSNAMCLGLPLTNTQAKGWIYSVVVFIIFNIIMFLFIACGQYAIFRAMSGNRISKSAVNMPRSRRVEDITVAKQLSLVVLSNFLFWFPVGVLGLMSLGGHGVSSEVYGWTTVLLLPINSAANPILYTIPALMAKWERFKTGDHRTLS